MEFLNPFEKQTNPIVNPFGDEFTALMQEDPQKGVDTLLGVMADEVRLAKGDALHHIANISYVNRKICPVSKVEAEQFGTSFDVADGAIVAENVPIWSLGPNVSDDLPIVTFKGDTLVAAHETGTKKVEGLKIPTLEAHIWLPRERQEDNEKFIFTHEQSAERGLGGDEHRLVLNGVAWRLSEVHTRFRKDDMALPPISSGLQERFSKQVLAELNIDRHEFPLVSTDFKSNLLVIDGIRGELFHRLTGRQLPEVKQVFTGPQPLEVIAFPRRFAACYGNTAPGVELHVGQFTPSWSCKTH
jgi:hypothetical protein